MVTGTWDLDTDAMIRNLPTDEERARAVKCQNDCLGGYFFRLEDYVSSQYLIRNPPHVVTAGLVKLYEGGPIQYRDSKGIIRSGVIRELNRRTVSGYPEAHVAYPVAIDDTESPGHDKLYVGKDDIIGPL